MITWYEALGLIPSTVKQDPKQRTYQKLLRVGEVVPLAKCFPHKHKDLHSIPSMDFKKPKVAVKSFGHFSFEVLETGEPLRLVGQQVSLNQPSWISPGGIQGLRQRSVRPEHKKGKWKQTQSQC